jgi:hypothetical protein
MVAEVTMAVLLVRSCVRSFGGACGVSTGWLAGGRADGRVDGSVHSTPLPIASGAPTLGTTIVICCIVLARKSLPHE